MVQVLVVAPHPGTSKTDKVRLWPESELNRVREAFPQIEFLDGLKTEDALKNAEQAEIAFGHLSREVFLVAPQLKWIQSHGAGMDWIQEIPELINSDVVLTNARGAHASTIAEHTLGMLVFLARGFDTLYQSQQQHLWLRPLIKPAVGLAGKTMGIIGMGTIGKAIAYRANAFGMKVIGIDAHVMPLPEGVTEMRLTDGGLDWLLQTSDVVIVTAPRTPETYHFISEAQIALMKPTAYLIGISRGGVIDEAPLKKALYEGRLAGAGLDVQEEFPVPSNSDLWDTPNLFLTPHCSGESQLSTTNATDVFIENLKRYFAGQPLINPVDKQLGY